MVVYVYVCVGGVGVGFEVGKKGGEASEAVELK